MFKTHTTGTPHHTLALGQAGHRVPRLATWLDPSFTSQSPQVSDRLAAEPPSPRQEGQPSGGCCCWLLLFRVSCVVCRVVCGVWCVVVYGGVLWCIVVYCGVLWCIVVYCGVLWCIVVYCGVLWCIVCCCVLLCVIVCCCVLLCVVVCCCVLLCVVVCCCVLLCVVVCCCVFLCVVVCCGVLWWCCGGVVFVLWCVVVCCVLVVLVVCRLLLVVGCSCCWNLSCMFTETSTPSPVPSICTPPWAGGVSPPNIVHTHKPRVPSSANDAKAKCAFTAPEEDELKPRHWHQLFRHLRLQERERCGAVCRIILGTSMTCSTSGNKLSRIFRTSTTEPTICGSEVWRRGKTGALSMICSTMRRGTRSGETVRPRASELRHEIVVEEEVLSARLLGEWVPPQLGRVLLVVPTPRPWPSSVLEEWCENTARAKAIDCHSCLKPAQSSPSSPLSSTKWHACSTKHRQEYQN